MQEFNPFLAARSTDTDKGSPAGIEVPDQAQNIGWQTRPALPTAEENALADALQAIFADEVYDLSGIVERLNRAAIKPPAGTARWSEENFSAELMRLGA